MRLAAISKTGGRANNEDAIGRLRKNGLYCFVLADGLGGQGGGETASRLAVKTVIECFKSHSEISSDVIYAYLEAAQNAIIEERRQNPQCANMGTTITVLVTDGYEAIWAHCGDSRIYRIEKRRIQEVTDDHSVAFASFCAGEISYDDIRKSPDQNKLLRTLSDGSKFRPDISGIVQVSRNTKFLMCSDGMWEYVDEDFMEKSLKKSSSPKEWLDRMVVEREMNAPENSDNFSAIAVFIQ